MMVEKLHKLSQFPNFVHRHDPLIPTMRLVCLPSKHTRNEPHLIKYVLKSTSGTWSSVIG